MQDTHFEEFVLEFNHCFLTDFALIPYKWKAEIFEALGSVMRITIFLDKALP